MPPRRVLHVVDDDADVRDSAELLLSALGYDVRTHTSGVAFLAAFDPSEPACILLDIHMPGMDGLEVQRQLGERNVSYPVIVLTGQGDISIAVKAMKNGAFEFLEKPYQNEVLTAAVADGFQRLESTSGDRAMAAEAKACLAKLTGRETEVLRGLLAGLPNKLIAYELDISIRTVEIYRANVMAKFDAKSLSTVVRMALAAGLQPLIPGRGL
jgi:two-component system response regulator FixJ